MTSETAPERSPSAKRSSVLRANAIMAFGMMALRILGFIRSVMLLTMIGTTENGVSAAFQAANALPNIVSNLLASSTFDAVLVPQVVGTLKCKHDDGTYVNRLLTFTGILLFIVTILSMVVAPLLVAITTAGYDSEIRTLAILFALLCLPQLFFYDLYNLLGELLNTRRVFGPYIWAPVVSNLVGIADLGAFLAIWGSSEDRIEVADFAFAQFWLLGGSATLGVIAQALIPLVPMECAGIRFAPGFHFRDIRFGSTSEVVGWIFVTLGVGQVGVLSTNNLVALADAYAETHDGVFAGISTYAAAFMIFMLPRSLIAMSLTTTILARMAEAVTDGDDRDVAAQYTMDVRTITSLTLLATVILVTGSVPMTQVILPSYSNQGIIAGYTQILVTLMPDVASTGMILMNQGIFLAYEDMKPVFLIGIGPTITQVIVGWDMHFITGATWQVVSAALGETACRLVQGAITVVWVSKRNAFVDKASLLRSYSSFFASAPIAGLFVFGALWAVDVHTTVESTSAHISIATGRMLLVALVASSEYLIVLRFITPGESARTIAPLLARSKVPNGVCILLATPLQTSPRKAEGND